jgi:hypothetical protein
MSLRRGDWPALCLLPFLQPPTPQSWGGYHLRHGAWVRDLTTFRADAALLSSVSSLSTLQSAGERPREARLSKYRANTTRGARLARPAPCRIQIMVR